MSPIHRKAWRELCTYAQSFPEAVEDHPWGETVYKVRKKVFLFSGCGAEGFAISVKLPHSGDAALATGFAEPTGYGLGQHGWVSCRFSAKQKPPMDLLRAWIEESWRAVAPKGLVAQRDGASSASSAAAIAARAPRKPPRRS